MRKLLIFTILVLAIITVGVGYLYENATTRNNMYTSATQEVFTINSGDGSIAILDNLYNQNLISSKVFSMLRVYKSGLDFYAGDFGLSQSQTDAEVLEILSNPASNIDTSREFLITEGSTIDDIATDLAEFTLDDDNQEEILKFWSDPTTLDKIIANYDFVTDEILNEDILYPLEGYFYPDTYKISDDASIDEITMLFLDTMSLRLEEVDTSNTDFTTHQLLTMASIIERETLSSEDKPITSGVFYNRLEADMPLQSDITVLYAMQEHKEQVLYEDLKYESPYNTYLNKGLTPGPISTVSLASIDAAANPDDNDYLYFFADQETGKLYYSKTIEEHQAISSEYAWNFEN